MDLTYGAATGPCAVCEKPSSRPCSRCRVDFYCGKEHQAQDWTRHRKGCGVLALKSNEVLGRYLVAARAIPAGTILMREVPLVAFPVYVPPHVACVGCFSPLPGGTRPECARCGWPVCGEACSLKEIHLPECSAFQRANFKLKNWDPEDTVYLDALCALRMHLACQQMPLGPRLLKLKSGIKHQADSGIPAAHAMNLRFADAHTQTRVGAAVSWLRLSAAVDWIPEGDLERALGAVFMNCLEAAESDSDDPSALQVSGAFAGQSLLEHSCVPNAFCQSWALPDGGNKDRLEHVLVAARDIARGEHVSISYLNYDVQGTTTRRMRLTWWAFYCRCPLCCDPTEMGLHLQAWHCGYCHRRGKRCLVRIPDVSQWQCAGCGKGGSVEVDAEGNGWAAVSRLEARVKQLRGRGAAASREEWEAVLSAALGPQGLLHPTHAVVLQAKKELACGPFLDESNASDAPIEVLHQSLAYSRDLLRAIDVLHPGISPPRRQLFMNVYDLVGTILDRPAAHTEPLENEFLALNRKIQTFMVNPEQRKKFAAFQ